MSRAGSVDRPGPIEVNVDLEGVPVLAGALHSHRRGRAESATFTYDPGYLAGATAYAFDPELPLSGGPRQTRTGQAVFGAFGDSAPDRWGRMLIDRREAALARSEGRAARALGEIDYLLGVRDDLRQGALRFRRDAGRFLADDGGIPPLTDLPALLDLADRAERGSADLSDLQRLVRVGSSLGGARPKAHVRRSDGRIAIAKLPSAAHDTWNVMAWEKVALDLAASAGIVVPESQLLDLAGRRVLVLTRFDRDRQGGRVGYVSAMTMLEAVDGDRRTYLEIAEAVENVSADTTRELHQLWRRMAFSILISNTDDHLRNHGFLHQGGDRWRLAPALDVNPDPTPGPRFHATAIDDADRPADVAGALDVAGLFRLDGRQAASVLREVTDAVGHWRAVAARHGLSGAEIEAMAPAFAALEPR